MSETTPVDSATKRALAYKASVHPNTIGKLLRGEAVRGLAGHRARAVLEAEGLLPRREQPILSAEVES